MQNATFCEGHFVLSQARDLPLGLSIKAVSMETFALSTTSDLNQEQFHAESTKSQVPQAS